MSGNSFGKLFVVTTAGESHGPGFLAIVDGCPPGLLLNESDIQKDVDRRRPGQSRFTAQRRESDHVQILSGVFEGKTTGTPIALLIINEDARSRDYEAIKDLYRPGHGDYTYAKKYGIRDYRGGGRASARETVMRVAAGAIARKYLRERNITITAYTTAIGPIRVDSIDMNAINHNPFFFPDPDPDKWSQIAECLTQLQREGDSIGAALQVRVTGVPVGLGEPVFDKLDAAIASAMMGINAVKGVEIGSGFTVAHQKGSIHRDQMDEQGFLSNHAGGILAGISTGQDIIVNVALKPASSIRIPGQTQDTAGHVRTIVTKGRHDPCVGIRAVPVAEAMMALVLMDHYLRHKAQNR